MRLDNAIIYYLGLYIFVCGLTERLERRQEAVWSERGARQDEGLAEVERVILNRRLARQQEVAAPALVEPSDALCLQDVVDALGVRAVQRPGITSNPSQTRKCERRFDRLLEVLRRAGEGVLDGVRLRHDQAGIQRLDEGSVPVATSNLLREDP